MSRQYETTQKVSVVEQTTGRYNIILYDVEQMDDKYVYGLDEIREHFYADNVVFEDELRGNTVRSFEHELDDDSFEKIVIESESIQVEADLTGDEEVAKISWSQSKNSFYE